VFQNGTVNGGTRTCFFTHSGLQKFTEANAISAGETLTRKT